MTNRARHRATSAVFTPSDFTYDAEARTCVCPAGKSLYRKGRAQRDEWVRWRTLSRREAGLRPVCAARAVSPHPRHTAVRNVAFFRGRVPVAAAPRPTDTHTTRMQQRLDTPSRPRGSTGADSPPSSRCSRIFASTSGWIASRCAAARRSTASGSCFAWCTTSKSSPTRATRHERAPRSARVRASDAFRRRHTVRIRLTTAAHVRERHKRLRDVTPCDGAVEAFSTASTKLGSAARRPHKRSSCSQYPVAVAAATRVRQPAGIARVHGLQISPATWFTLLLHCTATLLCARSQMPWMETDPMNERLKFVQDALSDRFTMAECVPATASAGRPGTNGSRATRRKGGAGSRDRSRAPHTCPHALSATMTELLVRDARGPSVLGRAQAARWCCRASIRASATGRRASTVADLLARRGFVQHRRKRRPPTQHPGVLPAAGGRTERSLDRRLQRRVSHRRSRLLLSAHHRGSRVALLLTCHGLRSTKCELAKPIFERAFREYGLPRAIRTDNGVPFATAAIHGLSFLNVYWMQLGHRASAHSSVVAPRERRARTHASHAQAAGDQTGAPDLCRAAAQLRCVPPRVQRRTTARNARADARRPRTTPSSPRPYPARLPQPEYPGHFRVKRITTGGTFRFGKRLMYLANALTNQQIGLEETDDGLWAIYFHTRPAGHTR